MRTSNTPLSRCLSHPSFLTAWCVVASFGTYACMYGFRKPFTAATYGADPFEPGVKTLFVTAQVFGYMLSKFIGIKVISEMPPARRANFLLMLIGCAEVALLLFAVTPAFVKPVCLFLNGLPLGMVFGLVLGFLEGRRLTEAFVAGLCASFIVADGVVKSVGAWLLGTGVSEEFMPFAAGLVFLLPLTGFVWMLRHIPEPTAADVEARSARTPMNRCDRLDWFRRHGVGLSLIVLAYLLITILRSLRADFAPELWRALGSEGEPSVFARSETLVAFGVMLASGLVVFVRDNRRALAAAFLIALGGLALIVVSLVGISAGGLGGFPFMVMVGLGLYLPYVVVHTTIFERVIAITRDKGNIGYLMYLADSFGYLGYVVVMFGKRLLRRDAALLDWFQLVGWCVALPSMIALAVSWWTFARHPATSGRGESATVSAK